MEPILKWVGGKRQLLPHLREYINKQVLGNGCYYEPFVGGGAVLFNLKPTKAIVGDLNKELITLYKVIKNNPKELISKLIEHESYHCEEYFYKIRSLDRQENFAYLPDIDIAARMVYLNRTCFNGLYRVNKQGYFNSPIGRTPKSTPNIVMRDRILEMTDYFNNNDIVFLNKPYYEVVETTKAGDLVYFDPPYDYGEGEGFTAYTLNCFSKEDTFKLRNLCDGLTKKGVKVVISNNETPFIEELFSEYQIEKVDANRMINCKADNRGSGKEVIIHNF